MLLTPAKFENWRKKLVVKPGTAEGGVVLRRQRQPSRADTNRRRPALSSPLPPSLPVLLPVPLPSSLPPLRPPLPASCNHSARLSFRFFTRLSPVCGHDPSHHSVRLSSPPLSRPLLASPRPSAFLLSPLCCILASAHLLPPLPADRPGTHPLRDGKRVFICPQD